MDVPGREEAWVKRTNDGWRLEGAVEVTEGGVEARLRYVITCDRKWRTRTVVIEGNVDGKAIRFKLEADGTGSWLCGGVPQPELVGAIDVDLGFTPATNTLPIRRLNLAVGESEAVRAAWLRFPELRLEPLEQLYTREAERRFRYQSRADGEPFTAILETDSYGRVLRYEGLWEAEQVEPDA